MTFDRPILSTTSARLLMLSEWPMHGTAQNRRAVICKSNIALGAPSFSPHRVAPPSQGYLNQDEPELILTGLRL
jgi:hypothetical protein